MLVLLVFLVIFIQARWWWVLCHNDVSARNKNDSFWLIADAFFPFGYEEIFLIKLSFLISCNRLKRTKRKQGDQIASWKSFLPCQNYIIAVRKNLHNSDSLAHKPSQYTTNPTTKTNPRRKIENDHRKICVSTNTLSYLILSPNKIASHP